MPRSGQRLRSEVPVAGDQKISARICLVISTAGPVPLGLAFSVVQTITVVPESGSAIVVCVLGRYLSLMAVNLTVR